MTAAEVMPAKNFTVSAPASQTAFMTISKTALCSIYGIIPLCWAIMLVDNFLLNGMLRKSFPSIPESLLIIAIFLQDPHITGSFFSFYDKEYFAYYKNKLLLALLFCTLLVCAPTYFFGTKGWIFVGVILLLWNMEHVVGQQFGLTRMMMRTQSKSFPIWWWSGLGIGILLSLGTYAHAFVHDNPYNRYLEIVSFVLLFPFIASASIMHRQCKDAWGIRYLWLNCVLIVSSFFAYIMGYSFFTLFMARIVHDATAFLFYTAHDKNRNAERPHNILYRPFRYVGISVVAVCPILAILIAFPETYILHQGIPAIYHIPPAVGDFIKNYFLRFGIITGLLHFYTDSFIWKKGSLHRRYISLA